MPNEAKKFAKLDKDWLKLMERANEQRNVIQCCTNDMLKSMLGPLREDLEFCQKKLENYLESKRKLFPRFYFRFQYCPSSKFCLRDLIQTVFRKILRSCSMPSQELSSQRKIENPLFQSKQCLGDDEEEIHLTNEVKAEGNIEQWLLNLEHEMQRSVREVCKDASRDCFQVELEEFVKYQSQIALLGIQMIWTSESPRSS